MRGAYQDSLRYYRLAYKPKSKRKKGRTHRIAIKVRRPGIALLYRKSYIERDERSLHQRAILNALHFPDLFRSSDFEVFVQQDGRRIFPEILIPVSSLLLAEVGGMKNCRLEFYGALFDENGSMVNQELLFSEAFQLDLTPEQYRAFLQHDNVTKSFDHLLPKGRFELRVAVRQYPSGSTSVQIVPLTVGDP